MAKKKEIQLTELKGYGTLKVFAYLPQGTVAPSTDERQTTREWVSLGKDNLFLERMRNLADNSVALDMCINANALYFAGRRVVINREVNGEMVPHEEAMARYLDWTKEQGEQEFRSRTMLDVAFGNARSWHVRYDSDGSIAALDHLDLTSVRSGKPNEERKVDTYFVSPDWKRVRGQYAERPEYKPLPFPKYDPLKPAKDKEAGQIEYVYRYKQGRRFYGEPYWLACVADAQVDSRVAPYNRNAIDTNFTPTVHIHATSKLTAAQQAELAKSLEKLYTGSRGNGIILTTGSPGEEQKITPLPANTQAGALDTIRTGAKLEIVNANQIPAILANIDIGKGSLSEQPPIRQQVQRYERAFVEPMQDLFFERPLLEKLVQSGFTDIAELYIESIAPFDEAADEVQQRQAYMRAVTVDEHRQTVMKLPPMTLPGTEVPDPRGGLLLIEAGTSIAPPGEEEKKEPKDKEEKEEDEEEQDA